VIEVMGGVVGTHQRVVTSTHVGIGQICSYLERWDGMGHDSAAQALVKLKRFSNAIVKRC